MVFVDDESEHPISNQPSVNSMKKYLIPNRADDKMYAHLPVRPVQKMQENDVRCNVSQHVRETCQNITRQSKCTAPQCKWETKTKTCVPKCDCYVQSHLQTRCGRITDGQTCYQTEGCIWDEEMKICERDEQYLHYVLMSGLLIPLLYIVCYYFSNKGQIANVWKQKGVLQIAYLFSVLLASCSILYLIYSVYHMRTYQDTRYSYANPLLTLFIGAMTLPVFRMLWITRDYSKYWLFACLFTTSAGLIWFMSKYFKNKDSYHDRLGVISMYYSLFHIVLFDNFIWWWILFIDSSKS